jgi:predicted KAP-like P-loop ATPase
LNRLFTSNWQPPNESLRATREKLLFGEIKQDVVDAAITSLISRAGAERRDTVKNIVELLFPPITRAFSGEREVSRHKHEWLRQARVCHVELFDKYFTFTVPVGDLSQIELDSLVDATKDRQAFVTHCEAMLQRNLLKPAFERLDAFKDEIPTSALPSLIRALSDLSDKFSDPTPDGLIDFDAATYAFRLIYFGLRRETDANRRFEILRDAFNDSSGLLLAVETVSHEERVGDREARNHEFVIDEAQLPALKEICIRKLREAAKDGSLRKHRRVTMLLLRWSQWASSEEVRAWVSKQVVQPKGAAWLLAQLVSEVRSHGRETKITPFMKLSTVERFADLAILEQKLKNLDESKISEKEKTSLREFRRALKRRQEGKPEFDGWNRELDD